MKQFNEDFKTRLYDTIEDIENNSLVEIVAIIKAHSARYRDISLWGAFLVMAALYTFFMFAPIEFNVYLIYFFTVLSFPASYYLLEILPAVKRPFVRKKRMRLNTEIFSRAIFQKGGVRHTNDKIGVLFYVSVFEKQVRIVADRGAEHEVPKEEWENIQSRFDAIFTAANKADAFIEALQTCKETFAEYIPPIENDINELPDNLQVEFEGE